MLMFGNLIGGPVRVKELIWSSMLETCFNIVKNGGGGGQANYIGQCILK